MLKKYDNRRLYDTERSAYVCVTDVRARVVSGEVIHDKRGVADLTATTETLLNIIKEDTMVAKGPTAEQLRQFIRSYSTPKPLAKAS